MSAAGLNRVIESIDANLAYLHKQRWALEASQLRNVVRNTTGIDKERAQKALRDHRKIRDDPETSRAPLVEEARMREQARQQA